MRAVTGLQIGVSILAALLLAAIPVVPIEYTLSNIEDWTEPPAEFLFDREFLPIPTYDAPEEEVEVLPEEPPEPPEPEPPTVDPNLEAEEEPTDDTAVAEAEPKGEPVVGEPTADTGIVAGELDEDPEDPTDDIPPDQQKKRPKKKKKPKTKKFPPCPDPSPDIIQINETTYHIRKELVEWYANHPFQVDDLAATWTHEDKQGRNDGFGLSPSRCSVLKQAGFKRRDIVRSVNGREISTLFQAIGAYFAFRGKEEFEVVVTRAKTGETVTLHFIILEKESKRLKREEKEKRKEERREAREARKEAKKKAKEGRDSENTDTDSSPGVE